MDLSSPDIFGFGLSLEFVLLHWIRGIFLFGDRNMSRLVKIWKRPWWISGAFMMFFEVIRTCLCV